jgi:hypothetical protein
MLSTVNNAPKEENKTQSNEDNTTGRNNKSEQDDDGAAIDKVVASNVTEPLQSNITDNQTLLYQVCFIPYIV